MATWKVTFSLSEPLATQFLRRIPSRERSRFVSDALASRLADRDQRLIRACEIANQDQDIQQLERDFDALPDPIAEPWSDATSSR